MKKIAISLSMIFGLMVLTQPAHAEGSVRHLAQASTNAAQASGHIAAASGHAVLAGAKLTSGTIAVPLMVSGAIGQASGKAGEVLWKEAHEEFGKPLKVSDETVTAGPAPDRALEEQKAY